MLPMDALDLALVLSNAIETLSCQLAQQDEDLQSVNTSPSFSKYWCTALSSWGFGWEVHLALGFRYQAGELLWASEV